MNNAPAADLADPRTDNPAFDKIMAEIETLHLLPYVQELDEQGLTVIPPALACPNGLDKRLLEAILDVAEKRSGVKPDLADGSTHVNFGGRFAEPGALATESVDDEAANDSPIGEFLQSLLFEGEVFEEALMNPVLLAMSTWLLGYLCNLSGMSVFIKGRNRTNLELHTDTLLPNPLPGHALVCNCTYALTEYSRANGSIAFVPGSHKRGRAPDKSEVSLDPLTGNADAVHVDAPAGSLIVFHGATWHGAYNRQATGLRVSMPVLMTRTYMRTEEHLCDMISDEMLARNAPRFAILTQQGFPYSFTDYRTAEARGKRRAKLLAAYDEQLGGILNSTPQQLDLYG